MRENTKIAFLVILIILGIGGLLFVINLFVPSYAYCDYDYVNAFPNLSFSQPVGIYSPNDGSNRLFVLEKGGSIQIIDNNESATSKHLFLDIRDQVSDDGERGLLGLAFHPNFTNNNFTYIYYTNNTGDSIISRFSLEDENTANESSEYIILRVEQPASNHNGGQIAFGPDGYLYIALGDGGGGGDTYGNAQNRETLLGSILRIDIDSGDPYAIPGDNPFFGNDQGYKEEIYAYGLRNPWRFSFDNETELLWAADVGQNAWEEINIIDNGGNYGWPILEGTHCYESLSCNKSQYDAPIYEYSHSFGQSITGGYVYRGNQLPCLNGKYIYGDFINGKIWALDYTQGTNVQNEIVKDLPYKITSFGEDSNKELLICTIEGNIYKLVRMIK
ncbi:MAG: Glucose sorbosone dehydrogenase [Promethearchaeota archaeon]|nr:MAG: Glucose sorbosone dehydrogenase [Candidatus Lokiarchaeota archaeon]